MLILYYFNPLIVFKSNKNMISKAELRKNLPHGSFKLIAQKAGVSRNAVTRFFNDQIKTSPSIEKAALECALEYRKETEHLIKELSTAIHE